MNHTIKGILIVAAITSMLVLGATSMVPIMQNSFAHKKSDFKGAERDPNTNINRNRNSADSSSTSSATADNTNNITNSASSNQAQSQSACAVAVTCQEGSTTVTPTPPTSTCNPSTVGGITATPTDGTCTATLPLSAGEEAVKIFAGECHSIPGSNTTIDAGTQEIICTFPSTPSK